MPIVNALMPTGILLLPLSVDTGRGLSAPAAALLGTLVGALAWCVWSVWGFVPPRSGAANRRARRSVGRRSSDVALHALVDASPLAILAVDAERRVTLWNAAAESLFGWKAAEVVGARLPIVLEPTLGESSSRPMVTALAPGVSELELRPRTKSGVVLDVSLSTGVLRDAAGEADGFIALVRDVTERKRLEAQLRQAQKMEAVGRLAGGVAHDFNNVLTAIKCYSGLLLQSLGPDSVHGDDVREIERAAGRAAALTGQLLAFSRRQILRRRVVDLNEAVIGLEQMLRRLVREDIALAFRRAGTLGKIFTDPGQMDQVLMNLVVNAADAMPRGGTITVETADAMLDDAYFLRHRVDAAPGPYVMLSVSDTGIGMDAETQAKIFEPFFTTKTGGGPSGTGLGLSTVYGIVKQSNGFVWVYSEVGKGTTFKVFLPREDSLVARDGTDAIAEEQDRGSETILVAEDDDAIRPLMRRLLERRGYRVLEARHGVQALELAERQQSAIDLLVTDVVMPELGGRELAENLVRATPDLRVLFMSGYTDDVVLRRGLVDVRVPFLQKPFSSSAFARKVREVLDAPTVVDGVGPIGSLS
ncbi:MAG: hypothetical protein NVS9B3_00070 [Gemmatimonadaceae bacterium]